MKTKAVKLPRNIVGPIPLENALRISLLLVESHKNGKHKNQNVAECPLCKTRRG